MASTRGRYDPVFEPSSYPTYATPPPKATISNPFEIESQYSNNPDITPLEYDPRKTISKSRSQQLWQRSRSYAIFMFIGDTILSLVPVIFVILAFRALALDGEGSSEGGHAVLEAAKIAPTIFPIIFAAVVGRLMRTYALWKAERGTRLGVLEQLVGSQNLLAAIERAFVLRNYTLLGLSIIVLWALSPLGGQAALRVLEISGRGIPGTLSIYYFNTTNDSPNLSLFDGASDMVTGDAPMSAIYRACLLAPDSVQKSAVDSWSNAKIPVLESLPSYSADSNGWLDVSTTEYTSLTGIMLANVPQGENVNLSMETSYFHLDCTEPKLFNIDGSANFTTNPNKYYGGFLDWLGKIYFTPDKNKNVFGFTEDQSTTGEFQWSSFMVDTNWDYPHGNPLHSPINLIYASQGAAEGQIAAYNCTVGTTYVEANVFCSGSSFTNPPTFTPSCGVLRLRRSLLNHPPNTTTPLNSGDPVYMANFLNWFPFAAGMMHDAVISPTDAYIAGSDSPFTPVSPGYADTSTSASAFANVTGRAFSLRFARLINTVWQASMATTSIATHSSTNLTALSQSATGWNTAHTTAVTLANKTVYRANKVWVGLTLVVSFVLLGCGIAGMAFKYGTKAPDILGYVSTMTRDNVYFNVGSEEVRGQGEGDAMVVAGGGGRQSQGRQVKSGDRLGGLERARLLRSCKVQIANVKPWEEGGHVALRSLER